MIHEELHKFCLKAVASFIDRGWNFHDVSPIMYNYNKDTFRIEVDRMKFLDRTISGGNQAKAIKITDAYFYHGYKTSFVDSYCIEIMMDAIIGFLRNEDNKEELKKYNNEKTILPSHGNSYYHPGIYIYFHEALFNAKLIPLMKYKIILNSNSKHKMVVSVYDTTTEILVKRFYYINNETK